MEPGRPVKERASAVEKDGAAPGRDSDKDKALAKVKEKARGLGEDRAVENKEPVKSHPARNIKVSTELQVVIPSQKGGDFVMPGYNGTGPLGAGPMTGRGGGYCMSYVGSDAGLSQSGCYPRRRHHTAGLYCWARWPAGSLLPAPVYAPPLNSEQELDFLKDQAENLEKALEQMKKRIKDLESKG